MTGYAEKSALDDLKNKVSRLNQSLAKALKEIEELKERISSLEE